MNEPTTPQRPQQVTVAVTTYLRLDVAPGLSVSDAVNETIQEMSYAFYSRTDGVQIREAVIEDFNILNPKQ